MGRVYEKGQVKGTGRARACVCAHLYVHDQKDPNVNGTVTLAVVG